MCYTRRRGFPVAVWMSLLVCTGADAAAGRRPRSEYCDDRSFEAAREHNTRADRHARRGDFPKAHEELRLAHKLCPNPTLLFNMGRVAEAIQRHREAREHYQAYIALRPGTAKAEQARSSVAALDRRLAQTMGRLLVRATPTDATVFLDGDEARPLDVPIDSWLEPGHHRLLVRKEGFEDARQEVSIRLGETVSLDVPLSPVFFGGELTVDGTGGARVLVDGQFVGTIPIARYKMLRGNHTVKVEDDRHHPFHSEVSIATGDHVKLLASLRPLAPEIPDGQSRSRPGPSVTAAPVPSTPTGPMWAWGWSALGMGMGLVVGGVAVHVWSYQEAVSVENMDTDRPQSVLDAETERIRDRVDTGVAAAGALYGVGGALVATGVVLVLLDRRGGSGESSEPDSACILPHPGGVAMSFRF